MAPRWTRLRWLLFPAAVILAGGFAAAQIKEDPLKVQRGTDSLPNAPAQPLQGGGVVQQQSRPFYLQGAVVVLVCGGAIWTVCRSSRRL